MKENLKYVAAFVAGGATGGVVAYFLTRKRADERYSQLATEDIAAVKKHYHDLEKELKENAKKITIKAKLEDLGYLADTTIVDDRRRELEESREVVVETNGSHSAEDIFDDDPNTFQHEVVESDPRSLRGPYLISQAEYDDNDEFDKIEIVYYEGDDTLADEDESLIQDPTTILGEFDPRHFGEYDKSEPDQMLIRNPKLRADYTVIRDARTYTKAVLGFDEPDDKPPIKKMRRHE